MPRGHSLLLTRFTFSQTDVTSDCDHQLQPFCFHIGTHVQLKHFRFAWSLNPCLRARTSPSLSPGPSLRSSTWTSSGELWSQCRRWVCVKFSSMFGKINYLSNLINGVYQVLEDADLTKKEVEEILLVRNFLETIAIILNKFLVNFAWLKIVPG